MANIINLTPHVIKVVNADNEVIREYPSQGLARLAVSSQLLDKTVDGIPVSQTILGSVTGLPEPDGESVFIVAMPVVQACRARADVVAPDSGATAYRENGLIVGVRQFARY